MRKTISVHIDEKVSLYIKIMAKHREINNFDTLRPILYNLFKIVSVIHKKNIVHRDLKPENILVATDGKMVLADFGISWFDPEFYERHAQTKR